MSTDSSFSTKVIRSFLYSGAGNTFSKIINVIGLFVVLKLISPESFGTASIVLAIFATVQAVTELGLGIAIVQSREISKRETDSLFWLSLLMTSFLYFLIYVSAPFLAEFYKEESITELIRVQGLIVIFFSFYFVPQSLLKRDLFFKELAIINNSALLMSTVVMVVLGYLGFGAWSIIGGEVGNRVGQLILTQSYKPYWPRLNFNWNEIKDRVYFGLYATGSRLLYNLYSNADYLIVGRVFGTEAVGIYTLAYRIVSDTLKTLTSNLNEVAYPAFSRLQNELERLRLYFFTLARGSMQLNSIVLIVIALFMDEILLVAGFDEWIEAVPLIQLLAASSVLRTVAPLVPQLLNAVGQAKLNFYYSLSNVIIMPLAFLAGAQFGLIGVGWAWLIGYPIVVLLLFYFGSKALSVSLARFIGSSLSGFWLLPLLTAVGIGVEYLLYLVFNPDSIFIPVIGISVTVLGGIYIVYKNEKETIDLLRGKIKKLPSED